MRSRFRMDRSFEERMANDPDVKRYLERRAREALGPARSIAASFRTSGDYERSLEVRGRRLLTTDPAGHLFEFGGGNQPPRAPLRKAVQQVGARYEDTGR